MTLHLIAAVALLAFTTAPAAAQNTAQDVRSHIESQVPAANDFHRFLQRDLNQFFSARLGRTVQVEYQLFSDVPSQDYVVLPTYYAWVRITEGGALVEDGAVIVSAFRRTQFRVSRYISTATARADYTSVVRAFPAEMAKKILANANPPDERQDRQDSQCSKIPSQKERVERLKGHDPRELERQGYPSDPIVVYQKAKEIGNMRDAWGAIIMIKEGSGTKKDPRRADELWRDYWCTEVLPAFATRPDLVLVHLNAAAKLSLPSAMLRLGEVYTKGQFGQPVNDRIAADWKSKYDAAVADNSRKQSN